MGNNKIRLKYVLPSKQAAQRRAVVLRCEERDLRLKEPVRREETPLTMCFRDFYLLYQRDKGCRLKESTWETKKNMIEKHLLPFFGDIRLCDIQAIDVIHWQNELMGKTAYDGKAFSQTFLRSIHSQLSAILNHAIRFYHLPENPARQAGSIGAKEGEEMQVWSREEYLRFAEAVMDKPLSYYCFEVLYWCGIREGELLALTRKDFDFQRQELNISKTYHRMGGKDCITTPKTRESVRKVAMPDFLCEELQDYFAFSWQPDASGRVFPVTKYFLGHEMRRGSAAAGVKCIRIHDLRHSHVSLLIQLGYSAVDIAKRVGHRSIDITYRYAHIFPSVQKNMMADLQDARGE